MLPQMYYLIDGLTRVARGCVGASPLCTCQQKRRARAYRGGNLTR